MAARDLRRAPDVIPGLVALHDLNIQSRQALAELTQLFLAQGLDFDTFEW